VEKSEIYPYLFISSAMATQKLEAGAEIVFLPAL